MKTKTPNCLSHASLDKSYCKYSWLKTHTLTFIIYLFFGTKLKEQNMQTELSKFLQ